MKLSEKIMPVAAVMTALGSLACCLPLGIAAAAGAGGLAMVLAPIRPWLLGFSVIFLAIGMVQLYRSRGSCPRRSRSTIALFWIATVVVLGLMLFPQTVAGILADRFSYDAPPTQPPLADMNDTFQAQFNRASDRTRIILLLSPT
jgi:hypothetical protein